MPAGDRTGPLGLGPRTGRGMGYCSGYDMPGYANPANVGFGRGAGFGRGFGRGRALFGRGRFWYPRAVPYVQSQYQYTKEDELADLKAEKELIERDLKAIEDRIKELEKKKE